MTEDLKNRIFDRHMEILRARPLLAPGMAWRLAEAEVTGKEAN